MQHDDSVYLGHILDTAHKVADSLREITRPDFDANEDLRDAIAHRVQIIGEAAGKLSKAFRDRNSQIPWNQVIGMRHRIVHAYMDIDYDILWEAATKNLPEFVDMVGKLARPEHEE